jgi:VanZ family protein
LKHARELFWHYWLPLLVMLSLIALESTDLMSGMHTGEQLKNILLWIGVHLSEPHLELLNHVLRKCGHMVGYGLLCFCWLILLRGTFWLRHDYSLSLKGSIQIQRMWWRPEWAAFAVLCTFLVATSDELNQMSIPSRTGTWNDVVLDTSAAVVSAALVWAKASWRCRDTSSVS